MKSQKNLVKLKLNSEHSQKQMTVQVIKIPWNDLSDSNIAN